MSPLLLRRAALVAADAARRSAEIRRIVAIAEELALDDPSLEAELERSTDPEHAALRVAWTALEAGLGPDAAGTGGAAAAPNGTLPAPREARLARLEAAERIARAVLAERPASWEALTLAGAATYLRWSETRDPRLLRQYRAWEAPLERAAELAPERPQPGRYLASAYLELWPALSEEKRRRTRTLVAEALADRRTFGRLIGPWLEVAGEEGLAAVPETSWAWDHVRRSYAERREWERYCTAWERSRAALSEELRERLAEAERLLAGGELIRGRSATFALTRAPTVRSFAPLVDRALRAAPYGPVRSSWTGPATAWLEWAREQALLGRQPLSAESLVRLRSLAFPRGPQDDAERALAAWVDSALRAPGAAGWSEEDERSAWTPLDWDYGGAAPSLWLVPAGRAGGLRIALAEIPPAGGAVEVHWDGASRGCVAIPPGEDRLELTLPIEPGLHHLELAPLTGGRVLPGRTELLRRPPPPRPG